MMADEVTNSEAADNQSAEQGAQPQQQERQGRGARGRGRGRRDDRNKRDEPQGD